MSNPAAKHLPPRPYVVAAIMCGAAGFILFQFFGNATRGYIASSSLFYWWGFQWVNPGSETEHGWLILGLSVWLSWRNLRIANTNPECQGPQSIPPAIIALFTGLVLHALGFVAQQTRLSIVAFLIFTWGVMRLGGGRRWGDAAMFPLAFMVFALPISVLDEIGLPLRVWVTTAGEHIAHLAGIDVLRSGTQLVAPDGRFNYDVAAPCSGVRSLMALTALSVLIGYLNFHSWGRRALLLGLSFPLVYLGNVARIVAIIFAAQAGGPEWGDRAHEVMGYGVFIIVLGGVLLSVAVIHRWWPEAEQERGKEEEVGRIFHGDAAPSPR
ncbi:MAG: exosortase/archaeosortase family protein, partial [Opitutaceae bacterium]